MSDDGDFILSEQDSFALSFEDRKNKVLTLYRQGKRRREIAKIARMSFSDIKKIIDAEFGPAEEKKNGKNTELSPYSQALKLFLSGAKPVTVSIKLSLSYEQVWKIYVQFLKLNRMHRLRKIYEELGDNNIKPFLSMYYEMQDNNFTPEQIAEAVKFVSSLPQLQERYQALETKTASLELKREELTVSVTMLRNQTDEARRELDYYHHECEKKKNEILQLSNEANARKNFIQNFDNEQGYIRIKEASRQQIESLLQDNRQLLTDAVSAIMESIQRYPGMQDLFYQLLTVGANPAYQTSSIELHKSELVALGEYIQMEMKRQIANEVITYIQRT